MYHIQEDEWFQEARLSYQLTQPQQNAQDALVRVVDDIMDRMEAVDDRMEEIDNRVEVDNRMEEVDDRMESLESIGHQGSQESIGL